jgi:WD40 repeat protein
VELRPRPNFAKTGENRVIWVHIDIIGPHVLQPSFTPMSMCQYRLETTIADLNGTISTLEFSPDGRILASGCEDGSVTLFSTFDWKPLQKFVDVSPSTSLVWHPRVKGLLFCGFKSGDVHTLQTNSPQVSPMESPPLTHCKFLTGRGGDLDRCKPRSYPLSIS